MCLVRLFAFFLFVLFVASPSLASLPVPSGQIKLIFKGNILKTNRGDYALLDQKILDTLTHHTFARPETEKTQKERATPKQEKKYKGYRLQDILDLLAFSGQRLEIFSKSGESFSVDYQSLKNMNPLLVSHIEDQPIKGSKAPFILIFMDSKTSNKQKNTLNDPESDAIQGIYKIISKE